MLTPWPPYHKDPSKFLRFTNVKAQIRNWIERENTFDIAILKVLEPEKAPEGIIEAIVCCNAINPEEFRQYNYPIGSVVFIDLIEPSKHKGTGMANFVKGADYAEQEQQSDSDAVKLSDVMSQSNTLQPNTKVKKITMLVEDMERWNNYMLRTGTNSWKAFNELLNLVERVPF